MKLKLLHGDRQKTFEQAEVLNAAGDISLYESEYKIHAYVIVGKKDGTAHGGHLMKAIVHPI